MSKGTVHHVLGLSGGRDSAALAVYMRQHYPELELTYFFTDTGKELPEVYEYLTRLEGFLGKEILRLNPDRDFDFWLAQYNNFLPSPQTRWCTRQLKLRPFEQWVRPKLESGDKVVSYVAIRSDEPYREGYSAKHENLLIELPFRTDGIDKGRVIEILESSGLGLPKYYSWRSRSGCTFCFFQQKIEWVRLMREHPDAFEEAKRYEKTAVANGSPFTWSDNESLEELAQPTRIAQIEADYAKRVARMKAKVQPNPLRVQIEPLDVDDVFGQALDVDDVFGQAKVCLACHK